LAFVDAFNNVHCHNKLKSKVERQNYKSKGFIPELFYVFYRDITCMTSKKQQARAYFYYNF